MFLISGPIFKSLLHKWSEFTSQVARVYFKSGASSNYVYPQKYHIK